MDLITTLLTLLTSTLCLAHLIRVAAAAVITVRMAPVTMAAEAAMELVRLWFALRPQPKGKKAKGKKAKAKAKAKAQPKGKGKAQAEMPIVPAGHELEPEAESMSVDEWLNESDPVDLVIGDVISGTVAGWGYGLTMAVTLASIGQWGSMTLDPTAGVESEQGYMALSVGDEVRGLVTGFGREDSGQVNLTYVP